MLVNNKYKNIIKNAFLTKSTFYCFNGIKLKVF